MKYPIYFFLSVFGFIASIMILVKKNNEPKPLYTDINSINNMKLHNCYDEAMTQWFLSFNKLQDKGHTLHEANELAEKAAVKKYNKCGEALAYVKSLPTLTVEL